MYISNICSKNVSDLINSLEAITTDSVIKATSNFMIAHIPINPMTEGTNRGKNVYCKFVPEGRLQNLTRITDAHTLFKLCHFETVLPNSLNHNHILEDLKLKYNILIPRKGIDI